MTFLVKISVKYFCREIFKLNRFFFIKRGHKNAHFGENTNLYRFKLSARAHKKFLYALQNYFGFRV